MTGEQYKHAPFLIAHFQFNPPLVAVEVYLHTGHTDTKLAIGIDDRFETSKK